MTQCSGGEARKFLSRFLRPGMRKHPQYYPISGRDALAREDIGAVFPESRRTASWIMKEDLAEDLRHWLREPAFAREQRQPLLLDTRQREIATTRTTSGLRRTKGPAGTGKTVALAARAAHLAAEGKRVLVCSYNLTLINYIRDIAAQYGRTQRLNVKDIVYLGFHQWCKRVCHQVGYDREYDAIWRGASDEPDEDLPSNRTDDALDHKVPSLTQIALRQARQPVKSVTFDAILVDEGQDWRPEWWNTLRLALREGGEMLLIADMTQDVYGRARGWTDEAMIGCGFRGPWFQLEQSYRLPMKLIPLLMDYGSRFLRDGEPDIPQSSQQVLDLDDADLRWRQTTRGNLAALADACVEEIAAQMRQPQSGSAIADITFLADSNDLGRMVVERLEDRGIDVTHTYGENGREARRQKMAFRQGAGKVKATTLHSFKGWESAQLIVAVSSASSQRGRAGLYTAMTRLQRTDAGSALTVVNAEPDLRSFGQTWPEFSDDRGQHRSAD